MAGTRVDANTLTFVYKKGGKVTITSKGTNILGQTITSVAVYDKQ